jgi:VanZ family protein
MIPLLCLPGLLPASDPPLSVSTVLSFTTRQMQRHALFYRIILAAAVAAISFLATTARHIPVVEDVSDKFNHILAFSVLGLLADFSWPATGFRAPKVLALLGYGLAIEVVQLFLPHRDFSLWDLGADALGLLLYGFSVPLLRNIYPLSERFKAPGEDDRGRPC